MAIDLVEDLISFGHEIELITPISNKYLKQIDEQQDECIIHRITSKFQKKDILSRMLRYFDVSKQMYDVAKSISDADLIMTHSMPPLIGPLGARLGKLKKIPVLYWEQDIVSESLISTGVFGRNGIKNKIMYKVAKIIEQYTEKNSTHIITISEEFKRMHINRGVSPEKIDVVYNWIDTHQVYPVVRAKNPLYEELNIPRDKFIVSYCGNLGIPQNVEIMIEAAEMLKDNNDILFLIIGGGSREEKIKKLVEIKNLPNLILYPLQPLEMAKYVYSLGNVGLVIGKADTSKNGFPSKTWSIMAAGQTMIACFDLGSELCEFVREGNCGITVEPDSAVSLRNAVIELYQDQKKCELMGIAARKYVIANFNRENATKKINNIAESMIQ